MPGWEWCSLPPIVMGLFIFAYLTCIWTVFYEWLGFFTFWGLLNSIVVHAGVSQLFYNYLKAVTTDPGSVPKEWQPHPSMVVKDGTESSDSSDEEKQIVKFCTKCNAYKAPRSHHCSECKKCTLKMDHHCPWINNCVGFYNHKYFVLFLVYLSTEGTHFIVLFFWRMVVIVTDLGLKKSSDIPSHALQLILVITQIVILLATVLAVSCLLGYQISGLMENMTSIESWDREVLERRAKRKGKTFHYLYNRGTCLNFREVCGWPPSSWLYYTRPEGNGLDFFTHKSMEV